jgi:hypothetical protein
MIFYNQNISCLRALPGRISCDILWGLILKRLFMMGLFVWKKNPL